MAKKDEMKMAVVAGASYAIEYKERNPRATESEIMNHVNQQMAKIIEDIENND